MATTTSNDASVAINATSTAQDFRSFQDSLIHPLIRLGLERTHKETLDDSSPFDRLSDACVEAVSGLEAAVEDVVGWGFSDFAAASAGGVGGSALKLDAAVLLSRLFRCKSEMHPPLFELLAQVKLYSKSWNVNRHAMLELERDYQRHYYVLDVAIRKLEGVESRISRLKAQHCLGLWEKLALRVLNHLQNEQQHQSKPAEQGHHEQKPNNLDNPNDLQKNAYTNASDSQKIQWILTKQAIIDGIIEEPSWRAQLRQVIHNFKTLLTEMHPGWHQIMTSPWIKPGTNYLSTRTGTCRPKKPPHIYRSVSLPCLRSYYAHEKEVRRFVAWSAARDGMGGDDRGGRSGNPLRQMSPRVRVNSMNARDDLTDLVADIVGGGVSDIDQMHIQQHVDVVVDEKGGGKGAPSDMVPEHRYFTEIMTPESRENLVRLVRAQNTMEARVKAKNLEVAEVVEYKDTFDLAEVMELTLLHAQQLHVLKDEYEARLTIMQEEMDSLQKEKDEEIERLRKNLELLEEAGTHEGAPRIEYKDGSKPRLSSTGMSRSLAPLSNPDSRIGTGRRKSSTIVTRRSSASQKSNPSLSSKPLPYPVRKTPTTKPDIPKAAEKPREETLISFRNRNQHSSHKGPRFTSAPFNLTFFERLEWFSKASIKLHEKLRLESQSLERRENERKLAYLNLIAESEDGEGVLNDEIPAEFMPNPGNIPSSFKAARDSFIFSDIHGVNGPWGGRFKIAEKAKKLNVLNLFDIALKLPALQYEESENSEVD